ncbi:hypothetical protein [Duganella aceris]|uniref:DUF1080 domain-containing protein n=1 Tax=Duganella aceris TaxID=2703883 RepID=A0ABX0FNH5_9BURK|nr:hypothetical protein [Duganella aceris]NGZ86166.1 hypothetical protein [Duganella aceris]
MRFIQTAAGLLLGAALLSAAAKPVDLRADGWQATGDVQFSRDAAHPQGVISVRGGGAVLKGMTFGDGTIEYDINQYADSRGVEGIWFRQLGESAESFYLRPDSDCPASVECIQYSPVSHGNEEWDVYPEFQARAPVKASGWNHVKLVISGKRMNVYINGEQRPSLAVARLAGDALSGQVQLRGDAMFANLDITPDAVEGLAPEALITAADTDRRFLRFWQVSAATTLARGAEVDYAQRPAADSPWHAISAESKGFVNIGRRLGTARGVPDLVWLKTTLRSDRAQAKHVALGWARQIWVFVNGHQVYADRNGYYPASARKPPLGRMALENSGGGFDLPLAAGDNQIEIAISNDLGATRHWGWGFEFRLDDVDGVTMPAPRSAM